MKVSDYVIDDDSPEESQVTCINGCPEGAQGRHKFSCSWAGRWFFGGLDVKILGESRDGQEICLEENEGHFHGRRAALLSDATPLHSRLTRVRHPDVTVHLSTGHNGNTMSLLATVGQALRRAGYSSSADALAREVFAAESPHEALQVLQQTVHVT